MKKSLILLLLPFIFLSCSSAKEETTTAPSNTYTVVFFDKTQSVNPNDSFVRNKYQQALRALVDKNINQEGDVLDIYLIHENTAKAKVVSVKPRTLKPNTDGMSPTDREAASLAYDMEIKKERQLVYDALLKSMLTPNTSASNNETNVSGSVPVIAAAIGAYPNVQAYFFSDMVESMKSGRDFHKTPPTKPAQAESWAIEDAKKYSSYNLQNAGVSIILPFSPTSSSKENNPLVTDYWETFFRILGVGKISEE